MLSISLWPLIQERRVKSFSLNGGFKTNCRPFGLGTPVQPKLLWILTPIDPLGWCKTYLQIPSKVARVEKGALFGRGAILTHVYGLSHYPRKEPKHCLEKWMIFHQASAWLLQYPPAPLRCYDENQHQSPRRQQVSELHRLGVLTAKRPAFGPQGASSWPGAGHDSIYKKLFGIHFGRHNIIRNQNIHNSVIP